MNVRFLLASMTASGLAIGGKVHKDIHNNCG